MISRSHPSHGPDAANGGSRGRRFRRREWLAALAAVLGRGVVVGSEAAGGSGVQGGRSGETRRCAGGEGVPLGKRSAAACAPGLGWSGPPRGWDGFLRLLSEEDRERKVADFRVGGCAHASRLALLGKSILRLS